MQVFEKIKQLLDENGISYDVWEHEPVRTSADAARIRGAELKTGAKSMIVKTKDQYYLLVLPADKRIDWKKVKEMLHVKEVRFATEEEAELKTGVEMGSVPPLGNVIGLETFYDRLVLQIEKVNFNPGSRTHTIKMQTKDLVAVANPTFAEFTLL